MNIEFTIELYDPEKTPWESIKERIIFIENQEFGEKSFSDELLERDFTDRDTVAVLIKDSESNIIGFTYAQSIGKYYQDRISESRETVLIWDTVIEEEHRGKHLVGKMMERLEEELRKRGYKYVERYARVANNYADNIAKFYKDRIVEQKGPLDSVWGPQIFFRIKL